jgi:hypothetical protein
MKLKEIDEIYQELLRSEMADVYELIEGNADSASNQRNIKLQIMSLQIKSTWKTIHRFPLNTVLC